ncbi:MAG TPA: hypothetical protein VGC79_30915, partial [Polyangiaceae bacterium]
PVFGEPAFPLAPVGLVAPLLPPSCAAPALPLVEPAAPPTANALPAAPPAEVPAFGPSVPGAGALLPHCKLAAAQLTTSPPSTALRHAACTIIERVQHAIPSV